ncbi:hypothetical protein ACFS6H_13325 [Terrimonas rubra]|uniref:Uncharacterized protein n=1 Tax=Terrimonas rubra TaxID=1035890 RepID=A0ABW6A5Q8_9BACT
MKNIKNKTQAFSLLPGKKLKCYLVFCFQFLGIYGMAQQVDSLKLYKDFLSVCTQYQVAPLQLRITYNTQTNLVVNAHDTSTVTGYFQLSQNGDAYMRFGEMEQLVTDTLAFWINHTLKQVIVDRNVTDARNRIKMYTGGFSSDSSIKNLVTMFSANHSVINSKSLEKLEILSREKLAYTDQSKRSINVLYNSQTAEPIEITTVRRTLIPIAQEDSAAFLNKYGRHGATVSIPKVGLCFVREYKGVYTYQDIGHKAGLSMPLKLSDYLVKNNSGSFVLVPGKSNYTLKDMDLTD